LIWLERMTANDELPHLLERVGEFALRNGLSPISNAIIQAQDVTQFGPTVDIKVGDMSFWAIRLNHLKDRNIECPGLAEFVEKVKTTAKDTPIKQTVIVLSQNYYLHTYSQNTEVFAAFLTEISTIRRRSQSEST